MSDHLKVCQERYRRLKDDILKLEAESRSQSTRLKLLVLKRDLQDLVRKMRQEQAEVGQQMSQSTAVTQAVNAYARTAEVWKNRGR
ncbi:hypothetical protein [Labrenzia sp. OB1]|uniref:hypothetical protein n=1 Tax=Labrenzia sp. OB1 TaxID=1561204 RepID=UPI0007B2FBD6|nr:hypothetical protein [Labrenzia sp. OB1]KZM50498.1 hypothetical protein OA90_08475 [Labrenzia sp. OB1]